MIIRRTAAALLAALTLLAAPPGASAGEIEPELLAAAQAKPRVDFALLLADKADLAAATADAKTKLDKGRAVVAALQATATRSQGPLLAALEARGLSYRAFWIANAVTTQGSLADIQALAARADVRGAYLISTELNLLSPYIARRAAAVEAAGSKAKQTDYVAKALGDKVEAGVALVRAPEVWKLGFKGQGVVVGDHDVGVQWDHPALKNQYRGWNSKTGTASHAYNWRNAFDAADPFCTDLTVPCDPNGHGTHTTGTIVGYDGGDNQIGVAPAAQWMACRSLSDPILGLGTVPTYMDCMEWQIAPYPRGNAAAADPAMAPDVVSNSWGCLEACAPPLLKDANDAIYAAGIVQVVSAGNDGQGSVEGQGGNASCSTLAFPIAVYESSFTVGATNKTDQMASFSSLGPVLSDGSMRLKPNVSAPGVATRSSVPDDAYDELSGTSMAGPHVVGVVALVMSAEPRLIGRVADVRKLVELTANPVVGVTETATSCGGTAATTIPNNIFGHGRVDALAAVLARPRLTLALAAPASAKPGETYEVSLTVTQPSTGKIDVTTALAELTLPAAVTLVGSTPAPVKNTASGASRTLQYRFAKLEPGKSATAKIQLKTDAAGDVALASKAEADQVSPVAGPALKTAVASAVTTPAAPVAATEGGRYGGAFGLAALALFGGLAALRRRRI